MFSIQVTSASGIAIAFGSRLLRLSSQGFPLWTIHKGRPHRGGEGVGPKADIVREVAWIYFYRSSQDADKGGEGGVGPNADIVREVAWIYSCRSSQNADKGGEGVKNPENFADVLYVWSLTSVKYGNITVTMTPNVKDL